VEVADRWYGQRTFRPDRLPYIQADPELNGLVWSAGLGGHGMTGSMWAGQRTADLVEAQLPDA
jgi:glycine/D-amino acid oxidase-like deaminating enzyme